MITKSSYPNWLLTQWLPGLAATLLLVPMPARAGEPPQVWALGVSSATGNACTLAGLVNPEGAPTWAWFEWGTTTNYGALTPASDMGSGTNTLHFGAPVTGLTPATTYHFRAAATNLYGGAYGNDLTFTTPSLPQAQTSSASAVTANTATLNGTVNPEGSASAAWFEWGRTTSYGNRTAAADLGSGADALPLLVPIGGLSPGLAYHFRIAATNIFGAAYGDDRILTTLNLPYVVTSPATAVATNRATLNASINPRGLPTAAWFEWGTTPNYDTLTPASDMGSGTGFLSLTAVLDDLTPGMTYYFRAAATNSGGAAYGSDWTFTTPGPPRVWALPATGVTTERATLNGGVNPDGYATTAWFEWGTNTNYGNLSSATAMGNGTNGLPLSFPLDGLSPGVTCHFRVGASNSLGTVYSTDQSFTTRAHADTNTVTSLADNGPGSLRQVMADSAPGDFIVFGVTGRITLTGGGLVVDRELTITGPGNSLLALNGGGFQVHSGVHFTLKQLTLTNCWRDSGAAVCNQGGHLLVESCVFAQNTASAWVPESPACGGAVFNSGTATINSSIFVGNAAVGTAGSDAPSPGPTGGSAGGSAYGGAVYNLGTLELRASTFVSNTARGGTGGRGGDAQPALTIPYPGGHGGVGADANGGALFNAGLATVVNCTFTSNSAYGGSGGAGGRGGNSMYTGYPPRYYGGAGGNGGPGGSGYGVVCDTNGLCFLTNCTIAANSGSGGTGGPGGPGGSGGLGTGPPGVRGLDGQALGGLRAAGVVLANSVLSSNAPGGNCSGEITDAGHNLSSDTSCAFTHNGSMNNTDPRLGSLANHGGPTPTIPLLPGSPAIDAGATLLAPSTDQRGVPRPFSMAADIGAFEFWPTLLASLAASGGIDIVGFGISGQTCWLLSSPDLSSWVPIATNQIGTNGTVLFYDTCGPGGAWRFYRLVMR